MFFFNNNKHFRGLNSIVHVYSLTKYSSLTPKLLFVLNCMVSDFEKKKHFTVVFFLVSMTWLLSDRRMKEILKSVTINTLTLFILSKWSDDELFRNTRRTYKDVVDRLKRGKNKCWKWVFVTKREQRCFVRCIIFFSIASQWVWNT